MYQSQTRTLVAAVVSLAVALPAMVHAQTTTPAQNTSPNTTRTPSDAGQGTTTGSSGTSRSSTSLFGSRQSDTDWERGRANSRSFIPFTSYGYVGANLGLTDWNSPCAGNFSCDDSDFAGKIYTGGLLSRIVGLEVAYVNMGEADRNGGKQEAQGINLSVVGNLPLTQFANVFGKVGTTYGWTDTSAATGTGVASDDEDGFALSWGAGVGIELTREIQLVGEWDRFRFKFSNGRQSVDMFSLGVRYKF